MLGPVLARTRDLVRSYRWRWLDPAHNVEAIDIPALISPLRYDVVAIRDFLRFYLAERTLARRDLPRFLERARRSRYYQWMSSVYELRFATRVRDPVIIAGRLTQRVRDTIHLWEAVEAGFDRRFPIEVRVAGQLLPTESGKRLSLRYILGDGSHRLACLMAQGLTKLPPDYYRLRWFRRHRPYDATGLLTSRGRLPEDEYFAFLSEIYGASEVLTDRISFLVFVTRALPEREAEVRTILRVDGFPV